MTNLVQHAENESDTKPRTINIEQPNLLPELLSGETPNLLAEPLPGEILEALAAVAHETNRQYCLLLGDNSQSTWDDAPDWQKDSARKGVAVALKGAPYSAMHESWMAEKVQDGWVYGEVKDPEKKTHPCLVPYEQLPAEQQRKDHLFSDVVRAAYAALVRDIKDAD